LTILTAAKNDVFGQFVDDSAQFVDQRLRDAADLLAAVHSRAGHMSDTNVLLSARSRPTQSINP
jgi:hypothetical protein